jgi:hypothetical protein|tara:strand:- start:7735 stop:8121 length:387 start_codon:yes stop_codon:yes gene_type:complete
MKTPTVNIHGKEYVMVKDRIVAFYNAYPHGCIRTELVDYKDGDWIVKAFCYPNPNEFPETYCTGLAHESHGSSQINQTSALENCETSAVGRCLAMAGFGTEESIASAEEVKNAVYQQEHRTPNKALAR